MNEPRVLTEQECAEIEARAEKATEGPWVSCWDTGEWPGNSKDQYDMGEGLFVSTSIPVTEENWWDRFVVGVTYYDGLHPGCTKENATFIAHSRADIPDLLATIKALRVEIESLKKMRRGYSEAI